jgi:hypothetical protein
MLPVVSSQVTIVKFFLTYVTEARLRITRIHETKIILRLLAGLQVPCIISSYGGVAVRAGTRLVSILTPIHLRAAFAFYNPIAR